MTFNLSLSGQVKTKTAKELRQDLVESILLQIVDDIITGAYPLDLAVKAVSPIVDTLHTGERSKGHASALKTLVEDNLIGAIEARKAALGEAGEAPGDKAKGKAKHLAA